MTKLEFLDRINDILIGLNTAESDALGSLYDELMRDAGWHPGSEHPVLEEDGTVVVISIHKDSKGMTHVGRAQCSKMYDKYYWDERNEWWCYPPKED